MARRHIGEETENWRGGPINRRAFAQMLRVAQEMGWPSSYDNDLFVHDRGALEKDVPEGAPFAWVLRATGTHLFTPALATTPEDRHALLGYPRMINRAFGDSPQVWFWWDGLSLEEMTYTDRPQQIRDRIEAWYERHGPTPELAGTMNLHGRSPGDDAAFRPTFIAKTTNVWVGQTTIFYVDKYARATHHPTLKFRIDGRKGEFRVDVSGLAGWEAIDDGVGFPTFEAAENYVTRYLNAVAEQGTRTPRVERAGLSSTPVGEAVCPRCRGGGDLSQEDLPGIPCPVCRPGRRAEDAPRRRRTRLAGVDVQPGPDNTFTNYHSAYRYAVLQARKLKMDHGIRKVKEFGKERYRVFMLPRPENTYGSDLLAERVRPSDPLTD